MFVLSPILGQSVRKTEADSVRLIIGHYADKYIMLYWIQGTARTIVQTM